MQQPEQPAPTVSALRSIEARVAGQQHGPISRLISPDGLGERLKPFIFLDFFNAEIEPGFGFGMHPHSGIATLTWQPGSDVRYQDTTGKNGVLKAGGLEWMNAGSGAWHQGSLLGHGQVTGFQLWVPMPPGMKDGPSFGQYVAPDEVPDVQISGGAIKVLLGSMNGIDPLSWTLCSLHERCSRWPRPTHLIRLSSAARWSIWFAPDVPPTSSRASSSRPRNRVSRVGGEGRQAGGSPGGGIPWPCRGRA